MFSVSKSLLTFNSKLHVKWSKMNCGLKPYYEDNSLSVILNELNSGILGETSCVINSGELPLEEFGGKKWRFIDVAIPSNIIKSVKQRERYLAIPSNYIHHFSLQVPATMHCSSRRTSQH